MSTITISNLKKVFNPFRNKPWDGNYIFNREVITKLIRNNDLESRTWDYGDDYQTNGPYDELYHARRVAYLVVNKDDYPVSLDVGIPSMGFYPQHIVFDGSGLSHHVSRIDIGKEN